MEEVRDPGLCVAFRWIQGSTSAAGTFAQEFPPRYRHASFLQDAEVVKDLLKAYRVFDCCVWALLKHAG